MSNMNDNFRILGNNGERRVFSIPVGNLTPEEARKELEKLISDYKQEINITDTGYLVCGSTGPEQNRVLGLQEPVKYSTGHGIIKIPVEKKKSWFRRLFS